MALIAKKREVALQRARVFRGANAELGNWRQVTVQEHNILCLSKIYLGRKRCVGISKSEMLRYTRMSVQSPLVVLKDVKKEEFHKSAKRRRLFLWQVK
ncbi:MAG: hypothetical protein IKL07_10030 [Clostridium sp.]|nr:hypothetical protein [Clostridium sp.]